METNSIKTDLLEIGYETGGCPDGPPLLLLHGWPDDVRGWRGVVPHLKDAGFRWVAPWLRGSGPTGLLSLEAIRDGSAVALAQEQSIWRIVSGLDEVLNRGTLIGARELRTRWSPWNISPFCKLALRVGFLREEHTAIQSPSA
jgi:pimeloyl-ACP methyl ester carboxylesterase